MRLFLALPVPEDLRRSLAEVQKRLAARLRDPVRWVRPEGFHLTFKFLGEVPEAKTGDVAASLVGIGEASGVGAAVPWQAPVVGLGGFPPRSRIRVIWAGVEDVEGRLERLWKEVESRMHSLGFDRERRSFHPHITLGRARDRRGLRGVEQAAEPWEGAPLGVLPVERLELIRSRLEKTGARYETLASELLIES